MRNSSLKHLVSFQKNNGVKDSLGGITESWVSLMPQEWVQIIPLKGEEKYQSKSLNTEVNHKIRMRYRDGLDSKMKIIYGTRVFEIDSIINPFERNRELQIMATEVFDA